MPRRRRNDGDQQQSGGTNSTNLQAGRDMVLHGASRDEVRDIVLSVFHENFLELRGVAEEVAIGRAEKITNAFLNKLQVEAPEKLENFGDPDLQRSVFTAQREFACSGEEDLGEALVDLLIDRTQEEERNLRTLALNEAISVVSKLTAQQRRAIAAVFLVRYTRYAGAGSIDAFVETYLCGSISRFASGLPLKVMDYQHIEYVGAGSISINQLEFGAALRHGAEGLFTTGILPDELPNELREEPFRSTLFTPCLRDPSALQLRVVGHEDIDALIEGAGAQAMADQIKALAQRGLMSPAEAEEEVKRRVPELTELVSTWKESNLKNLTLTSVGIAIGHAYWKRATGKSAALSIWL